MEKLLSTQNIAANWNNQFKACAQKHVSCFDRSGNWISLHSFCILTVTCNFNHYVQIMHLKLHYIISLTVYTSLVTQCLDVTSEQSMRHLEHTNTKTWIPKNARLLIHLRIMFMHFKIALQQKPLKITRDSWSCGQQVWY